MYHYPHFIDENIEDWEKEVIIYPGSRIKNGRGSQNWNSGLCDFRTGAFIPCVFLQIVTQSLYLVTKK